MIRCHVPCATAVVLTCILASSLACGGDDDSSVPAPLFSKPTDSPREVYNPDAILPCIDWTDTVTFADGSREGAGQAEFSVEGERRSGYSYYFLNAEGDNVFSFSSLNGESTCYTDFTITFGQIDESSLGVIQEAALPSAERCNDDPHTGVNNIGGEEATVYAGYYAYDYYTAGYLPDTLPHRVPRLVIDYVDTVGRFAAGRFAGGFILDRSCESFVNAGRPDRITIDRGVFAVRY